MGWGGTGQDGMRWEEPPVVSNHRLEGGPAEDSGRRAVRRMAAGPRTEGPAADRGTGGGQSDRQAGQV